MSDDLGLQIIQEFLFPVLVPDQLFILHSSFFILHSSFFILHSQFFILHSQFSILHSSLPQTHISEGFADLLDSKQTLPAVWTGLGVGCA